MRAGVVIVSATLLAIGLTVAAFRDVEGHLTGAIVLPLGLAAAVLVAGFAAGTEWARASWWTALVIAGQAVALQIVSAGKLLVYQHYPPPAELFTLQNLPALSFLALQTALVIVSGGGRLRAALGALLRELGPWRLSLVAGAFVLTSATLSASVTAYVAELGFATFVQAVSLATVALAVAALPSAALKRLAASFDRLLGAPGDSAEPGGVDRVALGAAAWVLAACTAIACFSYEAHPHVPDEVVYLLHARYFASGMLSLPPAPVPAAFELDLMTYEATRWYSPVPPGWPAALAVGAALGVPWLVNPVLNAINVLLTYLFMRELYDRRTARIAVLLLCVSPWFVFMGMNFMTHTFTLTCALGAAVAVARLRRGGSLAWVIPGGVAIGMVGIIRPLEGLTVALLLGFWVLGGQWTVARLARVAALAGVTIAAAAVTLPYNAFLSGDPLRFPLMAYTDAVYGAGTNDLGFGANRGLGWQGLDPFPGHGFIDVLVNANLNAFSVNIELLGWSVGSLLPLALLIAFGRTSRSDRWLLTAIAAVVGVHTFYWFSGGPDFGARYWYLIVIPCIGLTARIAAVGAERLGRPANVADETASLLRARVLAGMAILAASAVICFFPWRSIDKYYHYRNMRPDVRRLAATHEFGRSLVVVRGTRRTDYASAAIYNPLDLQAAQPIYIWGRNPTITRAGVRAYADRPIWILDAPSRTGAGYRVVAGPLTAERALEWIDGGSAER